MNGLFELKHQKLSTEIEQLEQQLNRKKTELDLINSLETRTVEALATLQETVNQMRASGVSTDQLQETVEVIFALEKPLSKTPKPQDVESQPTEITETTQIEKSSPETEVEVNPSTPAPTETQSFASEVTTPTRTDSKTTSTLTDSNNSTNSDSKVVELKPTTPSTSSLQVGDRVIVHSENYQKQYLGKEATVTEVNKYGVRVDVGDREIKFFLADQLELVKQVS